MEERAREGSKVVGKVREEMRQKVKEELLELELEALYKQVNQTKLFRHTFINSRAPLRN